MKKIKPIDKIEYILNKYVEKNDDILEIGCGCSLYRYSTLGNYKGLDITDDDYNEGNPRKVDIVASATNIPLQDNSIDLVFAVSTFYLIPNYNKALSEFYRILRPGGRLILFDYNKKTQELLSTKEKHQYPCWTQNELKNILDNNGFRRTEILLLLRYKLPWFLQGLIIFLNEFRLGGRAIVTGTK